MFPFLWSRQGCSGRTRCHPLCVFASSIRARSELRSQQPTGYQVSVRQRDSRLRCHVVSAHAVTRSTCTLLRNREGLKQRRDVVLDLCVSSVTQKISQIRLRIVTPLRRRTRLVALEGLSSVAFHQAPIPPWHCCDHSACKVHVSHLHVPCVWRRIEVRCCPPLP